MDATTSDQPRGATANQNSQDVYAIKQIRYRRGDNVDNVGILLQDVNGPCPIIALFNILLLRGNVSLPAGAGEVPVSRVVAMLAEYLLDKNEAMLNSSSTVSESVKADLQYNLADAISLIPMLTTGIDVNVRFNDIKGVEYTNTLCVFDLLGIDLVHGWIVDPQDVETATAIGNKTYNELAIEVITRLASGGCEQGTSRRGTVDDGAVQTSGVEECTRLDNGETNERVRRTSSDVPSTPPSHKASVAKEELEQVLRSMNLDRFASSVDESPGRTVTASENVSRESSLPFPRPKRTGTGVSSLISQDSLGKAIGALLDETVSGAFITPKMSRAATMNSRGSEGEHLEDHEQRNGGSELMTSALVVKEFLEATSSQLTYYGVSSLHEGLDEGQLAVFFRNNHFSTLLKHEGRLFVLVTDQGYQNETDIVWETLAAVDNDSEFVGWNFGTFSPHVETGFSDGFVDPTVAQADADFQLAQQLQAEEDARERRRAEEGQVRERAQQEQNCQRARREKKKKDKFSSLCSIM